MEWVFWINVCLKVWKMLFQRDIFILIQNSSLFSPLWLQKKLLWLFNTHCAYFFILEWHLKDCLLLKKRHIYICVTHPKQFDAMSANVKERERENEMPKSINSSNYKGISTSCHNWLTCLLKTVQIQTQKKTIRNYCCIAAKNIA